MRQTGTYVKMGELNSFIPFPLPPSNPPLVLGEQLFVLYGEASFAIGQLNEMCLRLPDSPRFIKAYIIKEALLSSSIEGIHTTLTEIFTNVLENKVPNKDTQLVINYTKAVDAALVLLKEEGLPLVSRVLLKTHEVLLSSNNKFDAGNFRKQAVRVGDLVPPPSTEVPRLIADLEKYMNENSDLPTLIKAGLVHVQFETIHPFLDGNGRIGRLLIVLMLMHDGLIHSPILYPSYFFKKHHLEYYSTLDRVRTHGDYEGWLRYYLKAIKESALDAYARAKEIENLELKIKELIQKDKAFLKAKETSMLAINYLFSYPITTISEMAEKIERSYNTVQKILSEFEKHQIVSKEKSSRNRIYRFDEYIQVLEKEIIL